MRLFFFPVPRVGAQAPGVTCVTCIFFSHYKKIYAYLIIHIEFRACRETTQMWGEVKVLQNDFKLYITHV